MTRITLKSKNSFISLTIAALIAGAANAGQPPDIVTSDPSGNTAMGLDALFELGAPNCNAASACYNTGAGAGSLYAITTGSENSAFGFQTLNNIRTGSDNTATGYRALLSNFNGNDNTAVGALAMSDGLTGEANAAVGSFALQANAGSYNTAMGYAALVKNTYSDGNTAVGSYALQSNTTGSSNTALGDGAMESNQTGADNIAIGQAAMSLNISGSNNIAVGFGSGQYAMGSNNIEIGAQGVASDNGIVRIGTPGTQSTVYIAGIESTKVTGSAVFVTSSGKLGVLASSERYKTAIESMGSNTDKLQQLRPVTFHLKNDPDGAVQYGLIAEEVDKVYPELVIRDDKGVIQGVRYDELAPMLLNQLQRQQATIAAQAEHLASQDARMTQVIARADELQAQLAQVLKNDVDMRAALAQIRAQDPQVAMR